MQEGLCTQLVLTTEYVPAGPSVWAETIDGDLLARGRTFIHLCLLDTVSAHLSLFPLRHTQEVEKEVALLSPVLATQVPHDTDAASVLSWTRAHLLLTLMFFVPVQILRFGGGTQQSPLQLPKQA